MIKINTSAVEGDIEVNLDIEGNVEDLMDEVAVILKALIINMSPENMLKMDEVNKEGSLLDFRYNLLDMIVEECKDLLAEHNIIEVKSNDMVDVIKAAVDRHKSRLFDNLVNEWYEIMSERVITQDEVDDLIQDLEKKDIDPDEFFDAIISKSFTEE